MSEKEKHRVSLGFDDELENFNPDDFKPAKSRAANDKPKREESRAVAEAAGFRSREPGAAKPATRPDRRYRSGRTAQIHLKATPEFEALFYSLCDRFEVKVVEGFEQAVRAWQRAADQK